MKRPQPTGCSQLVLVPRETRVASRTGHCFTYPPHLHPPLLFTFCLPPQQQQLPLSAVLLAAIPVCLASHASSPNGSP